MHVEAAGLRHHVTRQGEGPVVVMLHGLLVGSLASWYFTAAPVLARDHTVICTDLRGHGRSDAVAGGFDLATLTADLIAVLDALQVPGPVDLVGHSYGGLVALHTALTHPGRVGRLVLVDAPLPPASPSLLGAPQGATAEELVAMLPEAQRGVLAGGGRRATRFLQGLQRLLDTTLLADIAAEPPLDPAALAALTHPVSLVYGTTSACQHDGHHLAQVLPCARLTLLDGGHFLPLEAADALTAHLGDVLHGEVTANGVRLHVQRLGSHGPPVVFLHGLVMDNLSSWFFTAANPVAQHARVWLYDLRGHGRSERPARGYDVETLVADLAELFDAEGITEPAHLVGNSFGGLLALAFTLEHPHRVASLALVDPIPPVPGWSAEMTATLGLTGAARDAQIAESFQHWLGRHSGRKRNRLAQTAKALVEDTTLLPDLAEHPGLSDAAMLRLPQPVLLILGEHSDMRDAGHRLAAALSHATVDVVPDATHSVIWEHTATVRDRLVAWVREHA